MKNISLTQMSVPEFRTIIREELERMQTSQSSIPDQAAEAKEIMGVEETAEYLGIKRSAVYHKTHMGTIPHFKKGKKLYFRRSELEKWIESGRQKTVSEEKEAMESYLKNNQNKNA